MPIVGCVFSLRSLRQRELESTYSQYQNTSVIMLIQNMAIDRKGTEFIGNKQTNKQTNIHAYIHT